jgi:hypothetical protein
MIRVSSTIAPEGVSSIYSKRQESSSKLEPLVSALPLAFTGLLVYIVSTIFFNLSL